MNHSQRSITEADSYRVDIVVAFQFLELQTGVRGIRLEEAIRAPRVFLNVRRQTGQQTPELRGHPRLH
jgi:hypothetical protein